MSQIPHVYKEEIFGKIQKSTLESEVMIKCNINTAIGINS